MQSGLSPPILSTGSALGSGPEGRRHASFKRGSVGVGTYPADPEPTRPAKRRRETPKPMTQLPHRIHMHQYPVAQFKTLQQFVCSARHANILPPRPHIHTAGARRRRQDRPSLILTTRIKCSRPRLDGGEHVGRLKRTERTSSAFQPFAFPALS